MTVSTVYSCNLCGDPIGPSSGGALREGFGVRYHSDSPVAGSAWLSFERKSECARHICHACAIAVHDEMRKAMPAAPSTDAPKEAP